jgi:hypothetical protein
MSAAFPSVGPVVTYAECKLVQHRRWFAGVVLAVGIVVLTAISAFSR